MTPPCHASGPLSDSHLAEPCHAHPFDGLRVLIWGFLFRRVLCGGGGCPWQTSPPALTSWPIQTNRLGWVLMLVSSMPSLAAVFLLSLACSVSSTLSSFSSFPPGQDHCPDRSVISNTVYPILVHVHVPHVDTGAFRQHWLEEAFPLEGVL